MRSSSRRPWLSNRQSSTFCALAENSAKLVPRPSQLAPRREDVPADNRMRQLSGTRKIAARGGMVRLSSGTRPSSVMDLADIPDIAAAVMRGVRIENLAPFAGERHPDAVIVIDVRRKIHDDEAARAGVVALADPGEHVAVGVVGDDPFEAGLVAIQLMQRRQRAIKPVEVADQRSGCRHGSSDRADASRASGRGSIRAPGANSQPMNISFLPGWPNMKL